MGKCCVNKSDGTLREWVRQGELTVYESAVHHVIEQDMAPEEGSTWDGTQWIAGPSQDFLRRRQKAMFLDAVTALRNSPTIDPLLKAVFDKFEKVTL